MIIVYAFGRRYCCLEPWPDEGVGHEMMPIFWVIILITGYRLDYEVIDEQIGYLIIDKYDATEFDGVVLDQQDLLIAIRMLIICWNLS